MNKKVIITGATGFIGTHLCKELIKRGDDVTIFTRDTAKAIIKIPGAKNYVEWNYRKLDSWQSFLEGKDAVIHLAGANIAGKRWSKKYMIKILESRELSTKNLIEAIENSTEKPKSIVISSAVGYYGNAGNKILTEMSGPGNDFLSEVCKKWEMESQKVDNFGIRRLNIRTGVVLSTEEGALKKMLLPFKLFIGGPLGNGKQWFPWIHIDDIIRIFLYVLDNSNINGPVNAVSPGIITMKDLANKIGKELHRPSIFSVPKIVLRVVIGKSAESVLASQRVIPKKLLENGFKFKYENIKGALSDLLKK